MGRAATQIAIFLLLLTAASNAVVVSGVGDALGVQPTTGSGDQIERTQDAAGSLEPSQGSSETLFSLFTSGGSVFSGIYKIIFAAPLMFINLGVPAWLTTFVFAPMAIVVTADLFYILSGRDA